MAKIVGLVGTMSGRVGNMVFSKLDGKTIARSYQPQVANPNTIEQVIVRGKFALLTKLGAVLAPVIYPMASLGKSVRGGFISYNWGLVANSGSIESGNASVTAEEIKLTPSQAPMGSIPTVTVASNTATVTANVLPRYAGGNLVVAEVATSEQGLQLYRVHRISIGTTVQDDVINVSGNFTTVGGANSKFYVFAEAPTSEGYSVKYQHALFSEDILTSMQLWTGMAKNGQLIFSQSHYVAAGA